jgi:transcriptional regulator with XRE-family HTH domain
MALRLENTLILTQLRPIREDRALSQRDLSQKSGVTQATIVHAERGGRTRPSTRRKLAHALGVDPRELVDTSDRTE